jgi:predicted transcriptional regulator
MMKPEAASPRRVDTRVTVVVRITPAQRKTLRGIALDQDTTVQAIIEQAIADIVARHSK